MFNSIFVSICLIDYKGGILRVWSVSNSTPIENMKIKGTGFHSLDVINRLPDSSNNNCQIDLDEEVKKSHVGHMVVLFLTIRF